MKTENFNFTRTFGVELEFISPCDSTRLVRRLNERLENTLISFREATWSDTSNAWRVKPDSSIRGGHGWGCEIVSPVLQGQEGFQQLKDVLKALSTLDVDVNRSCGLHVHWGVSDWGVSNFKNLIKRYVKFESTIDSFMPNSRRLSNNSYCQSEALNIANRHGVSTLQEIFKLVDKCKDLNRLQRMKNGYDRYSKVNLESMSKHGTVEFRHHSASTDTDKVLAWVLLTGAMVEASSVKRIVKVKDDDTVTSNSATLNMMLRGLRAVAPQVEEIGTFYRRRVRHFARQS